MGRFMEFMNLALATYKMMMDIVVYGTQAYTTPGVQPSVSKTPQARPSGSTHTHMVSFRTETSHLAHSRAQQGR